MKRGKVRAWVAYGLAGLAVTGLAAAGALLLAEGPAEHAVITGAVGALAVQLGAFAMLLAVRDQAHLFLAGWLGGMVVRFGVLGVGVFWATRTEALPSAPLLLSLVGIMFVLLMLEPVFLRWDLRRP